MTLQVSAVAALGLTLGFGCDGDSSEDSAESDDSQDNGNQDDSESGDGGPDPSDSGTGAGENDGSDTGDDSDDGQVGATVSGTIEYSGSESGNLIVGLFTSNPPAGPPAVFPPFSDSNPTFPVQYDMTDVPPGTYYVIALLDFSTEGSDTGNNMPDDGEPFAASEDSIIVEAKGSYVVDLTLE